VQYTRIGDHPYQADERNDASTILWWAGLSAWLTLILSEMISEVKAMDTMHTYNSVNMQLLIRAFPLRDESSAPNAIVTSWP
jgi:hypothetical protein